MFFVNIAEKLMIDSKMQKYIRLYVGLLLCIMLVDGVKEFATGEKIKWSSESLVNDSDMEEMGEIEEEFRQQEERIQGEIEKKYKEKPACSADGRSYRLTGFLYLKRISSFRAETGHEVLRIIPAETLRCLTEIRHRPVGDRAHKKRRHHISPETRIHRDLCVITE